MSKKDEVKSMRAMRIVMVVLGAISAVVFLMSPKILDVYGVPQAWHVWIQVASFSAWMGLTGVESWRIWNSRRSS